MEFREGHALRAGPASLPRDFGRCVGVARGQTERQPARIERFLGCSDAAGWRVGFETRVKTAARLPTPLQRPRQPRGRRLSRADRKAANERLDRLKAWRAEHAKRLSLAPALIWPMAGLQRLASFPDDLETELEAPEVRQWQRERFEESLRQFPAQFR